MGHISFLFVFLSSFLPFLSAFVTNPNNLYTYFDTNDYASFFNQVNQWTHTGAAAPFCYPCANLYMMSGFLIGGTFTGMDTGLPPHDIVIMTFRFFAIDAWGPGDYVRIDIDGRVLDVTGIDIASAPPGSLTDHCGGYNNDFWEIRAKIKILHNSTSIRMTFTPYLGALFSVKSYGVREISTRYKNLTQYDTNFHPCLVPNNSLTINDNCPCNNFQQYYDPYTGLCSPCPEGCLGCTDEIFPECLTCLPPYIFHDGVCRICPVRCSLCDSHSICLQCSNGSYFLSNGSCGDCLYPMTVSGTNCVSACIGSILFWDQSCGSSCNPPLTQYNLGNDILCNYGCQSNEFLYSNGSCLSSCIAPYTISNIKGKNLCIDPCRGPSVFEYDDYTCGLQCSFPNISINMGTYFHCTLGPCLPGLYYYPNGSCIAGCSYPFVAHNSTPTPYCNPPCTNVSQFLDLDGNCKNSCGYPLINFLGEVKQCKRPCPPNFYFDLNSSTCVSTCNPPLFQINQSNVSCCMSANLILNISNLTNSSNQTTQTVSNIPAKKTSSINISQVIATTAEVTTSLQTASVAAASIGASVGASSGSGVSAFGLLSLNRFLFYMRFLGINYPQNVKEFFAAANSTTYLSLGLAFPTGSLQFPSNKVEPEEFDGWSLNSSFLANYWQTICTIILSFGFLLVLKIIERIGKYYEKIELLFFISQFELLVKWNFALIQFCTGYDSITLYAFIEFKTYVFNDSVAIASFACAVFCVVLMFVFLGLTFYLAKENSLSKRRIVAKNEHKFQDPGKEFTQKWRTFQILYAGYKDDSLFGKALVFFFMIRCMLWIAIIVFLYHYPMVQGLLMCLLSLFMIFLMLKYRPIINLVSRFEIPVLEIIIFFVSINVSILAIMDDQQNFDSETRLMIGNLIIGGFTAFGIVAFISIGGYFILGTISSIKTYKQMKAAGTVTFFLMVTIPFVSYGMDFKEFEKEVKSLVRKRKREQSIKALQIIPLDSPSNSIENLKIQFSSQLSSPNSDKKIEEEIQNQNLLSSEKDLQSTQFFKLESNNPDFDTALTSRNDPGLLDSPKLNISVDINTRRSSVTHSDKFIKKVSLFSGRRRSLCKNYDQEGNQENKVEELFRESQSVLNESVVSMDTPKSNTASPSKFKSFRRDSLRLNIVRAEFDNFQDKSLHEA